MHARFERIKTSGRCNLEVLGFKGAEEAFDRSVVKSVAFAAHALCDPASREYRSVRLHLVVPALIRMNGQFASELLARESAVWSVPETSSNTGRFAMRRAMISPL